MKEEHISKLRNMLSGEAFAQYRESIRLTGHPLLLRTKEQDPWQLTEEEARNILHDYAPELSLVLNGPTIVIFYEKK